MRPFGFAQDMLGGKNPKRTKSISRKDAKDAKGRRIKKWVYLCLNLLNFALWRLGGRKSEFRKEIFHAPGLALEPKDIVGSDGAMKALER